MTAVALVCKNEDKIKQIAVNLIDNAIKFTQSSGQITVYVKKLQSINGNISFSFMVKDTGIGIAQNALGKIFDNFYTNENVTKTYGGTGLGLSIISQYAKMLNSKINVKSQLKIGSEFSLDLTLKLHSNADKSYANLFKGSKVSIIPEGISEDNLKIINLYLKYLGVIVEPNLSPAIGKFKDEVIYGLERSETEIKILRIVPPEVFYPAPAVDSALVEFKLKENQELFIYSIINKTINN